MSKRIDHAEQAHVLLRNVTPDEMGDADSTNWLLSAQVHATLALVEQQRIANLIAIGQYKHEVEGTELHIELDASHKVYLAAGRGIGLGSILEGEG